MISGMVRHVLHQVRQTEVCRANRKHRSQRFVCDAIRKLDLFSLNLRPFQLHCGGVTICIRIEYHADSPPQFRDERRSERRLLENRQPTPLAADDVYECVSRGREAAAEITRKLLDAERGSRLQNAVVRPAVIFEEKLDVIFVHGDAQPFRLRQSYLALTFSRALSSVGGKATAHLANVIHSGKHYNHIRRRLGGLAVPPKERLGAVIRQVEIGIA